MTVITVLIIIDFLMVLKNITIIITIIAGTPKHLIVIIVTVILITRIIEIMFIIMDDILKKMNAINDFMINTIIKTITKEIQIIIVQRTVIILMKVIIEIVKIQKIMCDLVVEEDLN